MVILKEKDLKRCRIPQVPLFLSLLHSKDLSRDLVQHGKEPPCLHFDMINLYWKNGDSKRKKDIQILDTRGQERKIRML